ncbi:hypothetical protein GPX89_08795 [Nocardia sp. ET3-3]|uniref:Uncharacterized protein n=1 Tax=Nocardia terrae TaxID=2675851 RepID=A0A7K1USL9_9NOCA|nr:hypothetical protein [Nocardia terrae]MVU77343.1 hypothetical protein [Nocardia terrae]
MITARMLATVLAVFALVGGMLTVGSGPAAAFGPCVPGDPLRPMAELLATSSADVITDPADARLSDPLTVFDAEVNATAVLELGVAVHSELVQGVHWSEQTRQLTYQAARRFELACTSNENLCWMADDLRGRHNLDSELGLAYLPSTDAQTDGFRIRVPGIDRARLQDALLADPVARDRLGGGWITADDSLVLVADLADLDVARSFVEGMGAQWDPAAVQYGDRELVTGECIRGVLF